MKPRMSFFVTRPLMPVPLICRISTLCSRAIRRTRGDDLCRRASSIESAPPRRLVSSAAARSGVLPAAADPEAPLAKVDSG
jgi:hypothetical protein